MSNREWGFILRPDIFLILVALHTGLIVISNLCEIRVDYKSCNVGKHQTAFILCRTCKIRQSLTFFTVWFERSFLQISLSMFRT